MKAAFDAGALADGVSRAKVPPESVGSGSETRAADRREHLRTDLRELPPRIFMLGLSKG